MPQHRIHIEHDFAQPPEAVFAQLADHENFGRLLGVPVKRIKNAKGNDPNGVDSVRRVGFKHLSMEETVLVHEPPELIEYTISTGGGPICNHMGRLVFTATDNGGTHLDYSIEFDSRLPGVGKAIAKLLERKIKGALGRVESSV